MARLAAVSIVITSTEYLAAPRHLRDDGLMSWTVSSARESWLVTTAIGRGLEAIFAYPRVLVLIALRGVLALALLFGPSWMSGQAAIVGTLALTSVLVMLRSIYGQDGADHMVVIVYVSLTLAALVPTPTARAAALWFIALQGCLSYATAGIAKVISPLWRDGTHLIRVMGTKSYGNPTVSDYLNAHRVVARMVAIFIILWESAFPFVLFLPAPAAAAVLVVGALFHLSNAFVMGLNTFVWSFIATYPAILYCVQNRPW